MMKQIRLIGLVCAFLLLVLTACEQSVISEDRSIEGIYHGTLTVINGTKMEVESRTQNEGFAEISNIQNNLMNIHLYNDGLDTIFRLNYYQHRDSTLVCLTGDDFENMYGHMLGQGHVDGGMMGHMQNNETEWMHHLSDEHQEDDEHFGGFDMQNHTFGYRLNIGQGPQSYSMYFQGTKE